MRINKKNNGAKMEDVITDQVQDQKQDEVKTNDDANQDLKKDQAQDQKQDPNENVPGYEFEFKFVEAGSEVEKKIFFGKGNEQSAIVEARKQADEFSAGKYTVVFTGNFQKK